MQHDFIRAIRPYINIATDRVLAAVVTKKIQFAELEAEHPDLTPSELALLGLLLDASAARAQRETLKIISITRGLSSKKNPQWVLKLAQGESVYMPEQITDGRTPATIFFARGYEPMLKGLALNQTITFDNPVEAYGEKVDNWWLLTEIVSNAADTPSAELAELENKRKTARADAIKTARKWLIDETVVFADTETTGVGKHDEVVQIGVTTSAAWLPDGTLHEVERLVKPTVAIAAEAIAIHHITDEMVATANPIDHVFDACLQIKHKSVVTYNAEFDQRLIEQSFRAIGKSMPMLNWLCAELLFEAFNGEWDFSKKKWKKVGLQDACRKMGIEFTQKHTALDDVRAVLSLVKAIAAQPLADEEIMVQAEASVTVPLDDIPF